MVSFPIRSSSSHLNDPFHLPLSSFVLSNPSPPPPSTLLSTTRGVDERFSSCSSSFKCGKLSSIGYPFWKNDQPDYCGHPGFTLEDCKQEDITITILFQKHHVLDINQDIQILKIARMDFSKRICPDIFLNTSMDSGLFSCTLNDKNATLLYDCATTSDPNKQSKDQFRCPVDKIPRDAYFVSPNTRLGNEEFRRSSNISVVIPVMEMEVKRFVNHELSVGQKVNQMGFNLLEKKMGLDFALSHGFDVEYNISVVLCDRCEKLDGICEISSNSV
ncbi:hypothetical protein SLEP1_g47230 [Rubroshorea leprosula]|uniref:Wall-associated receptor kinase galacturonan-binding domain-containing protein n=1 Tax=Rubroshorea leprosula TaxID=152421 RepID=A0AAV5LSF5_9ROSI|nr:hypothetical protein SLEP1_g47230 [Rubroshorea leprosula]